MKVKSLPDEDGDEVTFLYNMRHVSSASCSSGVTRRKKERQSRSSKIKQQYFQKITRQHVRSRSSRAPSQQDENTRLSAPPVFHVVWLRGGFLFGLTVLWLLLFMLLWLLCCFAAVKETTTTQTREGASLQRDQRGRQRGDKEEDRSPLKG